VLTAAFGALVRLDREHAAVYFQIIWDVLRDPRRQALEALVMERQTEGKATFPPRPLGRERPRGEDRCRRALLKRRRGR